MKHYYFLLIGLVACSSSPQIQIETHSPPEEEKQREPPKEVVLILPPRDLDACIPQQLSADAIPVDFILDPS